MTQPKPKPLPTPVVDMVELETIVVDDRWQVRKSLDDDAVRRYAAAMEAGDEFPPVKLARVNGAPVLVSGFHRVNAARLARRSSILAEVYDARPESLLWMAARENTTHGMPMKTKEYRKVFQAYVRSRQYLTQDNRVKSSRIIVDDLSRAVSHATVLRWMKSDFPSIYRKMTEQGDNPGDAGGTHDVHQPTEEDMMLAMALSAIGKLQAAVVGIKSPDARGQLIGPLKEVLLRMDEATATSPDF